jgi:NADH-quinone oxidoreductase subunit N
MAAAVKIAAFATLLRVLLGAFDPWQDKWIVVVYYLAVATMIFGNVAALVQNRLKRLLAYSSIAHAGYLLGGRFGPGARTGPGRQGRAFLLLAYTLMTVGAFAVVSHLSRENADADSLDDYRGLARRHPWLAAALALFLISMAGLPPLVGFVGKFVISMPR